MGIKTGFFVSGDGIPKFFEENQINKMSLSVQRSVIEQFSFDGKKVHSVYVKGEECLVSRNVYMTIGYGEGNGKKAIQNLVPSK